MSTSPTRPPPNHPRGCSGAAAGAGAPGGARADVFRLRWKTPDDWAAAAAADVGALLGDHAHCELKAAASAMALIRRNPGRAGLASRLALLIREESEHLSRVLRELALRDQALRPDAPSPYAEGLHRLTRASRRGDQGVYLDALLVSALIEMRSHERFERLGACPALADLAPLYRALGEAEARHGNLFLELAREAHDAHVVAARFDVLAEGEGVLIASLPCGPRVHSGPPAA